VINCQSILGSAYCREMSFGSSRVRREARRFFSSALKGGRRCRWRDVRPGGSCRPEKATRRAEKSRGSKPRRKRGLRVGKLRSRGCHPRRLAQARQPPPKVVTSKLIRKLVSQQEYWGKRRSEFVERLRPIVSKKFEKRSRTAMYGTVFDDVAYRRWRNQYETLKSRVLCKAAKLTFPRWLVFLDTYYHFSPPGVRRSEDYLFDLILGNKDLDEKKPPARKRPGSKSPSVGLSRSKKQSSRPRGAGRGGSVRDLFGT